MDSRELCASVETLTVQRMKGMVGDKECAREIVYRALRYVSCLVEECGLVSLDAGWEHSCIGCARVFESDEEFGAHLGAPGVVIETWSADDEEMWLDWCEYQQDVIDWQNRDEDEVRPYRNGVAEYGKVSIGVVLSGLIVLVVVAVLSVGIAKGFSAGAETQPPVESLIPYAEGIIEAGVVDTDSFGDNEIGNPNVFMEDDGRLRVNCDAFQVLCDDEEA